ncbi:MAG: tRNA (guanosine(37)-N1)-methyltransferase TrmD [Bacteriovoracia bacterium]
MNNKIWIIAPFIDYFKPLMEQGVASRFLKNSIHLVSLRDYGLGNYKAIDDTPYGGGPGMVIRADVLKAALIEGVIKPGNYREEFKEKLHIIYTSPRGEVWDNNICKDFAQTHFSKDSKDLVFICGRYEGIDERFWENYIDEDLSLGDFVLTGGEIAVMAFLDSSLRFVEGVLGNKNSADNDSFEDCLIEGPQYTKPQEFEGKTPPEVLLSGHHAKIDNFHLEQRKKFTQNLRPDLWDKYKKRYQENE